jgi:hypothetical protein
MTWSAAETGEVIRQRSASRTAAVLLGAGRRLSPPLSREGRRRIGTLAVEGRG